MNISIPAFKAKFFPFLAEAGKDPSGKETNILDNIEKLIEISQKFGIDKCLSRGQEHFDYVTGKLGITRLQAILFSHFMEKSIEDYINLSEIAVSIKCSNIRIIKYLNECEVLEEKKLIKANRGEKSISFRVPREVRESLRKFNEYKPKKIENTSIEKLFTEFERLFEERGNDEITFAALKIELLDLIRQNMHLEFSKKIMSYNLIEDNLVLLICFCHLSGNNNDDNIGMHDLEFLYEDKSKAKRIKRELSEGDHVLIDSKIIEFNNSRGFLDSESWKVSDLAKKELLGELCLKGNQNFKKNLILFDTIKPKKMYYNARETGEIQKLVSLLSEENFHKTQERLTEKGMRKGFACLFSGGPGTGKTETAYQIARETKRNIMMVDISETKSMWYGESEKKIKRTFDSYRNVTEKSAIIPILLFNEADAVIGRRKEFGGANESIDQTENTIQNIILQEMENLSGIMIATNNLTKNMDHAFERRFLYKIVFDKPSPESRKGIWISLLPELPADKAAELSGRFELSGGQIENVVRKLEVDTIINGAALSIDTLVKYCTDECMNSFHTPKKIGFSSE